MAINRQPPTCPHCEEVIATAIYQNQKDTPPALQVFGDTFIRWEWIDHSCPGKTKFEKELADKCSSMEISNGSFRPLPKSQSARRGNGSLNGDGQTKKKDKSTSSKIQSKYPKLTEERMQKYIHAYSYSSSGPKPAIMLFNRYYFKAWESDVLIFSRAGTITEIEIKISIQDFEHDFTKEDKHGRMQKGHSERPNQFYYAVPLGKVPMIDPEDSRLPEYAGLIGIKENGSYKLLKSAPMQHQNTIDESEWKNFLISAIELMTFKQLQKL